MIVRETLHKSHAVATAAFREGTREPRRSQGRLPLASQATHRHSIGNPGTGPDAPR